MKQTAKIMILVIMTMALLAGCSKKTDISSLLPGTWYPEGSESAAFTLYDDGTCEIAREYGTGKWSVVNENQLKLENYYGEVETVPIVSIEDNCLTLGEESNKVQFWNSPRTSESEINESDQNEKSGFSDFHVNYFLDINSGDEFWVGADINAAQTNNGAVFVAVDKEMNPSYIMSADNYSICSGFYNHMSVIFDKQASRNMVIDIEGNDITSKYADEVHGESIVGMWEDETGITIWTTQDVDTFDSHVTSLYAKNVDGAIKQSWDSDKLSMYNLSKLTFVEKGIYQFGNNVIDVVSGNGFTYPPSGNSYIIKGVDESGSVFTTQSHTGIAKYSNLGEFLWGFGLYGDKVVGKYSSGLLFLRGDDGEINGIDYNGFVDAECNYMIPLELNVTNEPFFSENYALIECENSAGVKFVTLIDKQGTILFEPIQGESTYYVAADCYAEKTMEYPIATIDEQVVILEPDGDFTQVPDYWLNSKYECLVSDEFYYLIENGQINRYDRTEH